MSETEKSLLVLDEKKAGASQEWFGLKHRAKCGLQAARKTITGMAKGDFVEKTRNQLVDVKGKAGRGVAAAVRRMRIAVPEGLAIGRRIIRR